MPRPSLRFYREVRAAALLSTIRTSSPPSTPTRWTATSSSPWSSSRAPTLANLVKQEGPLPVGQACEYMRQAALGLQHAYEKGMVHRDIKPSNLVVQGSGSRHEARPLVKILDMGLARLADRSRTESSGMLTQIHACSAPRISSPPNRRPMPGRPTPAPTSTAWGVPSTSSWPGEVPFPANTAMEKLLKHYLEEPPPVEEVRPEVPARLGQFVRRLMAKAPQHRHQTPAEVANLLASMLAARPAMPSRSRLPLPVSPRARQPVRRPSRPWPRRCKKRKKRCPKSPWNSRRPIRSLLAPRPGPPAAVGPAPAAAFAVAGIAVGLLAALFLVLLHYALG